MKASIHASIDGPRGPSLVGGGLDLDTSRNPVRVQAIASLKRFSHDLHFPTVGLDTLSSSATAVFVFPSAHPSIIRARWANACAKFSVGAPTLPVSPVLHWRVSTAESVGQGGACASPSNESSEGYALLQ